MDALSSAAVGLLVLLPPLAAVVYLAVGRGARWRWLFLGIASWPAALVALMTFAAVDGTAAGMQAGGADFLVPAVYARLLAVVGVIGAIEAAAAIFFWCVSRAAAARAGACGPGPAPAPAPSCRGRAAADPRE